MARHGNRALHTGPHRGAAELQGCHVHASSTHCQSSFGRGDQRALLTTLDGTAQWRQCTTVRCLCGASRRGDVPPRAAPQCGAAMWSRVKAPKEILAYSGPCIFIYSVHCCYRLVVAVWLSLSALLLFVFVVCGRRVTLVTWLRETRRKD